MPKIVNTALKAKAKAKAWTFEAKAKAKARGPEAKAKAKAKAIKFGLEAPRGQGLASRTTSLLLRPNKTVNTVACSCPKLPVEGDGVCPHKFGSGCTQCALQHDSRRPTCIVWSSSAQNGC